VIAIVGGVEAYGRGTLMRAYNSGFMYTKETDVSCENTWHTLSVQSCHRDGERGLLL